MAEAGAYEHIAPEYYDQSHETCRFFEDATEAYFRRLPWLSADLPRTGRTLDVGSGAGLSERYLGAEHSDSLIHVDLNNGMLKQAEGVRVQANALELPFSDQSFNKVTSFLFDPFCSIGYLREALRVLANNGTFIGTLPNPDWATPYRESIGINTSITRFRTATSDIVEVPSYSPSLSRLWMELKSLDGLWPAMDTIHPHTSQNKPVSIRSVAEAAGRQVTDLGVLTVIRIDKRPSPLVHAVPFESRILDPLADNGLLASVIEYGLRKQRINAW